MLRFRGVPDSPQATFNIWGHMTQSTSILVYTRSNKINYIIYDDIKYITLWLFNIAMENHHAINR